MTTQTLTEIISQRRLTVVDIGLCNGFIAQNRLNAWGFYELDLYIVSLADNDVEIGKKITFINWFSYKNCNMDLFALSSTGATIYEFCILNQSDWLDEYNKIYDINAWEYKRNVKHFCFVGADVSNEVLAVDYKVTDFDPNLFWEIFPDAV